MWLLEQADAVAALPEVVLAVLAMALLMFGGFRKNDATDAVTIGALISLGLVATLVILGGPEEADAFRSWAAEHGGRAALVRWLLAERQAR